MNKCLVLAYSEKYASWLVESLEDNLNSAIQYIREHPSFVEYKVYTLDASNCITFNVVDNKIFAQ